MRGVQVHGAPAKKAVAGQRTAINLAGHRSAGDRARHGAGRVRSRFAPSGNSVACWKRCLERRRSGIVLRSIFTPARRRSKPRFACSGENTLPPGGRTYARIVLREDALLLPRDRFIIRRFSPVTTIGGGVVLDIGASAFAQSERDQRTAVQALNTRPSLTGFIY